MKITNIEVLPFGEHQVLIRVHSDDGVVGVGDATPLPMFTGENQGSILAAIERYIKSMILNENPLELKKLSEKMKKLPWNMAAKTGIEMALFDIIGKVKEIPVHSILGGKYQERFTQAAAVGRLKKGISSDEVAREALEFLKNGFQVVKIKIGKKYGLSLEEDYKRVQAVAEAIDNHARFWVDCQAAYSSQEAVKIAKKIEKFDPLYMEQPTQRFDIKGMAEVRRRTEIPIMADESVFSPLDALRVIQERAADAIGIKFAKCGGIFAAKQITTMTNVAGLDCMMISPGETNIGLAAYLHVAASAENVLICNFGLREQEDWLTPLKIDDTYKLMVPTDPGLGIKILKKIPERPTYKFGDTLL